VDELAAGAAIGGFLSLYETTLEKRVNHVLDENPEAYSIPNDVMTEWLNRFDTANETSERIRFLMDVARWGRCWAEKYPR
jgi:hypothetical protein